MPFFLQVACKSFSKDKSHIFDRYIWHSAKERQSICYFIWTTLALLQWFGRRYCCLLTGRKLFTSCPQQRLSAMNRSLLDDINFSHVQFLSLTTETCFWRSKQGKLCYYILFWVEPEPSRYPQHLHLSFS